MKNIILFFVLLFTISIQTSAQVDKDFPAPGADEAPDIKIIQEKYYDGNALWGHIDGGADLYLEYGFDNLLFQEIAWNKIKFRIEYYRMKDSAAAFGIFSVSKYKCDIKDTLTKFICITKFQLQTALGRFYISITNEKGTVEAENLGIELFKKILTKSEETLYTLPAPFNGKSFMPYTNNLKLFRGNLGLQNGMPRWIDFFEKFSDYEILVFTIENGEGYLNLARVKFASDADRIKFMRIIGVAETKEKDRFFIKTNGTDYIIKIISENEILFYETVFGKEELQKFEE
jgi:hypothetical protein